MLSRLALRNAQTLSVALRGIQTTPSTTSEPSFSRPVRRIDPSPVKFGFIPEEWFTFFYPKTGVTGPYVFITTLATYLVSKEIYVLEHEFYNGLSLMIILIVLIKKAGPKVSKYLEDSQNKYIQEWEDGRVEEINDAKTAIKNLEKAVWSAEGEMLLLEAYKENVQIQLEAIYRERLAQVYSQVKNRLDYNVNIQAIDRRISQTHMVQWIIDNVIKAITPEQEKATLEQCIKDLELLAAKA